MKVAVAVDDTQARYCSLLNRLLKPENGNIIFSEVKIGRKYTRMNDQSWSVASCSGNVKPVMPL